LSCSAYGSSARQRDDELLAEIVRVAESTQIGLVSSAYAPDPSRPDSPAIAGFRSWLRAAVPLTTLGG